MIEDYLRETLEGWDVPPAIAREAAHRARFRGIAHIKKVLAGAITALEQQPDITKRTESAKARKRREEHQELVRLGVAPDWHYTQRPRMAGVKSDAMKLGDMLR